MRKHTHCYSTGHPSRPTPKQGRHAEISEDRTDQNKTMYHIVNLSIVHLCHQLHELVPRLFSLKTKYSRKGLISLKETKLFCYISQINTFVIYHI